MLFPTSIVEMKLLGLWKKMDRIREVRLFSLRSISKRSLLEDTNAISMPEKNAENAMVTVKIVVTGRKVKDVQMKMEH